MGIGNKANADANVVPVASAPASPNAIVDLIPRPTYYVAVGPYTPATIFNVSEIGATKEISFTGGVTEATVTYHPNGTWS